MELAINIDKLNHSSALFGRVLDSFPLHVAEDYKICNERLVIGIYKVRSVLSTETESDESGVWAGLTWRRRRGAKPLPFLNVFAFVRRM